MRDELSGIIPGVSRSDDQRAAELRNRLGLEPLTYKNGGAVGFRDIPRFMFDGAKEAFNNLTKPVLLWPVRAIRKIVSELTQGPVKGSK